jgi:hypothetical protein
VKRFEKPGLKLKFRLTLEKLRGRKIDMDAKPAPSNDEAKLQDEPAPVVAAPTEPASPSVEEPVHISTPTPELPPPDDATSPVGVVDDAIVTPTPVAATTETESTPAAAAAAPSSPSLEPELPPVPPPEDTPDVGPTVATTDVPSLGDDVPPPAQTENLPALPAESDDDSGDSDDESAANNEKRRSNEPSLPEPIIASDPDPTDLPPAIEAPTTPLPSAESTPASPQTSSSGTSSAGTSAPATPTPTAGTSGDDKGAKFKTATSKVEAKTPTKPAVIAASSSDPKEKRPEPKKLVIPAPVVKAAEPKKIDPGNVGAGMKDRATAFLSNAKKDVAGQTSKGAVLPKAAGGADEFRRKADNLALVFGASVPGLGKPPPTSKKYQAAEEEVIDDNDETGDEVALRTMLPAAADITNAPQESGSLMKRGSAKASWKKRYCIVKDDALYWLKNEAEARPLGMIKLSEPGVKFKQNGEECEIVTSRRSYFLKAEDEEAMENWIKKFRIAKLAVVASRTEGAVSSGLAGFVKSGPPSATVARMENDREEHKEAQRRQNRADSDDDDAAAAMAMLKARDAADRAAASGATGDDSDDDKKGSSNDGKKSAAGSRRPSTDGSKSRKNSTKGSGQNSRRNSGSAPAATSPTATATSPSSTDAKKVDEKKKTTTSNDDSDEVKQHKQLFLTGTLFIKYKRKSGKKRVIHTSKSLVLRLLPLVRDTCFHVSVWLSE